MLSVQVDIAHPRGSTDVRPLMRRMRSSSIYLDPICECIAYTAKLFSVSLNTSTLMMSNFARVQGQSTHYEGLCFL